MMRFGHICDDCGDYVRTGDLWSHKCSKRLLKKRRRAKALRLAKKQAKELEQHQILKELHEVKALLRTLLAKRA